MTITKAAPEVRQVRVEDLLDSPLQLRKKYDPAKIEELAERMRSLGFFGTIIAREVTDEDLRRWPELVDGHCRKRAAKLAGITEVPVEIRDLDDDQVVAFMLAARGEPLSALEEGDGLRALRDSGQTIDELAASVGRPAAYVRQRIALANAPRRVRAELDAGTIGVGHALLIAGLPDELQDDALVVAQKSTHAELRAWAEARSQDLDRAPWNVKDAALHGGACVPTCDKRTGATADLFEGITGDRCLDAVCWAKKLAQAEKADGDIKRALEARGLELRRNGTAGRMNVVDEHGGVLLGDVTATAVRDWLQGRARGETGLAPLPPKRKQGKPLPAAAERLMGNCVVCTERVEVMADGKVETHKKAGRKSWCKGSRQAPIVQAVTELVEDTLAVAPLPPPARLPNVDEHRAEEKRRRDVFMQVIEKTPGRLGRAELQIVVEHVLGFAAGPEEDLVLAALRIDTGEIGAIDELSDSELAIALVAASLAKSTNPLVMPWEDSLLAVTAKRLGVVVDEPVAAGELRDDEGRRVIEVPLERMEFEKGDMAKAYAVDRDHAKPLPFFRHDGARFVYLSGMSGPDYSEVHGWRAVPRTEWKKKTATYAQLLKRWDKHGDERGNMTGMAVALVREPGEWVLVEEVVFRATKKKGAKKAPAKKKAKAKRRP